MAENHLPPVSVVQGRPLLLLGLILVAVEQYPFPKKTVVSHVCCFCHVNQFDKSFGADGFWSGHVLYKRQLFESRICLARSSPNKSFDDGDMLLEQIVWNSCFNDGLSCSRLIDEISETTGPTRAIASMQSVTISIWDFTARSLSQEVTIGKVAFFEACCMLARCKSAFS